MEVWTKEKPEDNWRREKGVLLALEALLENPAAQTLVVADKPDLDLPQLKATLRLAGKLGVDFARVHFAAAHPSLSWIETLAGFGLQHLALFSISSKESPPRELVSHSIGRLKSVLCPWLHVKTAEEVTLSICGAHFDRLVLVDQHLKQWCLRNAQDCPHIERVRARSDG